MRLARFAAVVASVAASLILASVAAQPSIPATFFGAITVNGLAPPAGLSVRGFIGTTDCTQDGSGRVLDDAGRAVYVLIVVHDSQKPGCGAVGREVTFMVGGVVAGKTAPWQAAPQGVDIDIRPGPGTTLEAGSPPAREPGAIRAETAVRPGSTAEPGARASGGGVVPWVLAGLLAVVAAGALGGALVARRRKRREKM